MQIVTAGSRHRCGMIWRHYFFYDLRYLGGEAVTSNLVCQRLQFAIFLRRRCPGRSQSKAGWPIGTFGSRLAPLVPLPLGITGQVLTFVGRLLHNFDCIRAKPATGPERRPARIISGPQPAENSRTSTCYCCNGSSRTAVDAKSAVLSRVAGSGPRPCANARSSTLRPWSKPGRP